MSRDVIYLMQVSLDGYVEDRDGDFSWAVPDAEIHAFINDVERDASAFLYGRRMWETLAGWEDLGKDPDDPPVVKDFAQLWRATPKIVFSRSLDGVAGSNTRLVRGDAVEEVRRLKAEDGAPLHVGGPALAGSLLRAGLLDVVALIVYPVVVGGGKPALPDLAAPLALRHTATREFGSGAVYTSYAVTAD